MKCQKCNVIVEADTHICPLCQNELNREGTMEHIFPVIPTMHKSHGLFLKILYFLFFVSAVLCIAINVMTNRTVTWSLVVVAAILCVLASLTIAIRKRHHFAKMMFAEYMIIMIFSLAWDYATGWNKWSCNFVLPLASVLFIYIMFILRFFFPYQLRNYFMNIVLACLIGMVPMILLVTEITTVRWTAYTSAITSIVMMGALLVFDGKKLRKEWESRFHV